MAKAKKKINRACPSRRLRNISMRQNDILNAIDALKDAECTSNELINSAVRLALDIAEQEYSILEVTKANVNKTLNCGENK